MSMAPFDWHPDEKKLRQFGLLAAGVVLALGGMAYYRGRIDAWEGLLFLAPALLLMTTAGLRPSLLRPVYLACLVIAFPIGWAFSHLLLGALFLGLFTTIGLTRRIFGSDALDLRRDPTRVSFWAARRPARDKESYFRQF